MSRNKKKDGMIDELIKQTMTDETITEIVEHCSGIVRKIVAENVKKIDTAIWIVSATINLDDLSSGQMAVDVRTHGYEVAGVVGLPTDRRKLMKEVAQRFVEEEGQPNRIPLAVCLGAESFTASVSRRDLSDEDLAKDAREMLQNSDLIEGLEKKNCYTVNLMTIDKRYCAKIMLLGKNEDGNYFIDDTITLPVCEMDGKDSSVAGAVLDDFAYLFQQIGISMFNKMDW